MDSKDYIEQSITALTNEVDDKKYSMKSLNEKATDAISELEAIKVDTEELASELDDYVHYLAGLQATLNRVDTVIDEAQNQNIEA